MNPLHTIPTCMFNIHFAVTQQASRLKWWHVRLIIKRPLVRISSRSQNT